MIIAGTVVRGLKIVKPFTEETEHIVRFCPISADTVVLTSGITQCGYDVTCEFDSEGKIESVILEPGTTTLVSTIEHFTVPFNLQGEVIDRSTWARLGQSVKNTRLKPGWRGHLTIEVTNESRRAVRLHRGNPIAEIQFSQILGHVIPYAGKYQDQGRGPHAAK